MNTITMESESRALQLAKKVFEHFTHDSLAMAKEIIALEQEIEISNPAAVTATDSPDQVTDRHPQSAEPDDSLSVIGLDDQVDPMQPVMHMDAQLVENQKDDLPF